MKFNLKNRPTHLPESNLQHLTAKIRAYNEWFEGFEREVRNWLKAEKPFVIVTADLNANVTSKEMEKEKEVIQAVVCKVQQYLAKEILGQ